MGLLNVLMGALLMAGAVCPAMASPETAFQGWHVALQAGAGPGDSVFGSLLRLQVGFAGTSASVMFSAPWYRDVTGQFRGRRDADSFQAQHGWRRLEAYIHWLEALQFQSNDGAIVFWAGRLIQETLGHALMVDHFTTSLHPFQSAPGARLDIRTLQAGRALGLAALVDHISQPRLGALYVAWPHRSWALGFETAWGKRRRNPASASLQGGAGLTLEAFVLASERWVVTPYAAVVARTPGAWGMHAGLRWEHASQDVLEAVAQLEGFYGGSGYLSAAWAMWDGLTDSFPLRQSPAGYGARTSMDLRWKAARGGGDIKGMGGLWHAAVYLQVETVRCSGALRLLQRWQKAQGPLENKQAATFFSSFLSIEGSYRLSRSWFVFISLYQNLADRLALPRLSPRHAGWVGIGWVLSPQVDRS